MIFLTMSKWYGIDKTPPDKMVEVMDENGNTGNAIPTWYPFTVKPSASSKYGTLEMCDPYWDGGWLVQCEGLNCTIGKIVAWREKPKNNTLS